MDPIIYETPDLFRVEIHDFGTVVSLKTGESQMTTRMFDDPEDAFLFYHDLWRNGYPEAWHVCDALDEHSERKFFP